MFLRVRILTVHLSQVGALASALLALVRKTQAPREVVKEAPLPSTLRWTSPPPPRWPS